MLLRGLDLSQLDEEINGIDIDYSAFELTHTYIQSDGSTYPGNFPTMDCTGYISVVSGDEFAYNGF